MTLTQSDNHITIFKRKKGRFHNLQYGKVKYLLHFWVQIKGEDFNSHKLSHAAGCTMKYHTKLTNHRAHTD